MSSFQLHVSCFQGACRVYTVCRTQGWNTRKFFNLVFFTYSILSALKVLEMPQVLAPISLMPMFAKFLRNHKLTEFNGVHNAQGLVCNNRLISRSGDDLIQFGQFSSTWQT